MKPTVPSSPSSPTRAHSAAISPPPSAAPKPPAGRTTAVVTQLLIPTYPEAPYEKLPMFDDHRVHQRTSGRVYPNAIVNGVVRHHCAPRQHLAVVLENDFLELIILPDLGGRIFSARDKTNDYHFFYRQHVIKPALIGLLGSWISGGAEFNWPLHHRPSTFLPVDFEIEHAPDGSATVWLSEHEPLDRMKGMVGIHLHPRQARFETRVRLFNRTPLPKSFLFWENIAVPVNAQYQIFFPPDVSYVHFHYKKSVTGYPRADGMFNGIDFSAGTDLRWHREIRNATSFFAAPSRHDFFGGYDHQRQAGVIHVADHHVSPGKKLFTWGYNQLARTWERALTDADGQYAELMAGSYSDNQPDFAWLEPLETKSFSQCWYPIKAIGAPRAANERLAVAVAGEGTKLALRLYATEAIAGATVLLAQAGQALLERTLDLSPAVPVCFEISLASPVDDRDLAFTVKDRFGREILAYDPSQDKPTVRPDPIPAVPPPDRFATAEDLCRAGLHVDQYRDPLIGGSVYWRESLDREPAHIESLKALGRDLLRGANHAEAARHLTAAIAALTKHNPNPRDGEAFYLLGHAYRGQRMIDLAREAFAKAAWSFAWRSAAGYGLAQIDCAQARWPEAIRHLREAVSTNAQNSKARVLLGAALRRSGEAAAAREQIDAVLREDPLDHWARHERALLAGAATVDAGDAFFEVMRSDPAQTCLDVAFDYTEAGLYDEAESLLARLVGWAAPRQGVPAVVHYTLAWLHAKRGGADAFRTSLDLARAAADSRSFPSRHEEADVLRWALSVEPADGRAADLLAGLLYARGQRDEATTLWETAARQRPDDYRVMRNLAVALYSHRHDRSRAADLLRRAQSLVPTDPQVLWELEYVMERAGAEPRERLAALAPVGSAVPARDDLVLARAKVLNQMGDHEAALVVLSAHPFVACEGGEHAIVEQYQFAHIAVGRAALAARSWDAALEHFRAAQTIPDHLGAGCWNIVMTVPPAYFEALALLGRGEAAPAEAILRGIVERRTDSFSTMYVPALPYYAGRALELLGRRAEGAARFRELLETARTEMARPDYGPLKTTPFHISYVEEPRRERTRHFGYLAAIAQLGLGGVVAAREMLQAVLAEFPSDLWALLEYRDLPGTNAPVAPSAAARDLATV